MAPRREARKAVLQALYANELGKGEWTEIVKTVLKHALKDQSIDTFKIDESIFLKVVNRQEEINKIIKEHIYNWSIERLNTIDRLILLIAITEFLFFE